MSGNMIMTTIPTVGGLTNLYRIENRLGTDDMDALRNAGWTIISNWIDNVTAAPTDGSNVFVEGVSFRMARGRDRLIVTADIPVVVPDRYVPNIDADNPGEKVSYIPSMKNELWLLRLVSMMGYGTASGGGPGLVVPQDPPPLSVLGLDIEQTTYYRGGGLPLPHDPIISIALSTGGWYDDSCPDQNFFDNHTG